MTDLTNVSIIGLGLIGGSLAKALKRVHPEIVITGMDLNHAYLELALFEKTIDHAAYTLEQAIEGANVIFLCTPVKSILECIGIISSSAAKGTIVSDTGSTKLEIMEKANSSFPSDVYFIGGHPMTGAERSGFKSSMPHLFENAYYVLTPALSTPLAILEKLLTLVTSTGAIPIVMEADTHDYVVGAISHLPHVVASSLVNTVSRIYDPEQFRLKLAAGGFKDITRIASSNPAVWRDISLSNKKHLLFLVKSMLHELNSFNNLLEQDVKESIESFFKSAKEYRDNLTPSSVMSVTAYRELSVDIEDKPGVIGRVTSLLGENGINIKNLRIIHNREDEPEGCLVISFASKESLAKSKCILSENGYKCFER